MLDRTARRGERAGRPLSVTVLDDDLVLQGDAPAGLFTPVLGWQNAPGARRAVTGRWWLGDQQGALRGRVMGLTTATR